MSTDRKAATRAYKDGRRPMGVYRVRNTETGFAVLGTSPDLPSMHNRIWFQLDMGSHPDKALQAEWNASGPDAFAFEVLDTIEAPDDPAYDPKEDLAELLELWRERLL